MHYIDKLLNKIPEEIREPLLTAIYIVCLCISFGLICELAFG